MHWLRLVVLLGIFCIFLWSRISKLLGFAGKICHRVHLRGKTHESDAWNTQSFCLGPDYTCNMMWNEWKGHEHKDFEIIEQDSRIFVDWNGMEAIFLSFNFYILCQWELPAGLAGTDPGGRDRPCPKKKRKEKKFIGYIFFYFWSSAPSSKNSEPLHFI